MDLRLSTEEIRFRDELRNWLRGTVPGLDPRPADDDFGCRRTWVADWQVACSTPLRGHPLAAELGGRGSTPFEHLLCIEESQRAGAPDLGCMFVGQHAGPTLILEATDGQKVGTTFAQIPDFC